MKTDNNSEPICCPPIDPTQWDGKEFEWNSKLFIEDKVFTFMYIPFGFGRTMKRIDQKVRAAKATFDDSVCLSEHTSSWNMNLYVAVDKEIPDAQNISLTGKFFSIVYEGPFKDTGKWTKNFQKVSQERGHSIKKQYMWYTTCPKCSKKYGKNYVVIVGEIG